MTSGAFLALGAPLFLAAAWWVPQRDQPRAMLVVSLGMLLVISPLACALAVGLVGAVHLLSAQGERSRWRLLAVLCLSAGSFLALKLGVRLGAGNLELGARLGFAYYSLRLLAYSFDRYAGRQARLGFGELLGHALFFPTLVSGPIQRLSGFERELRRRRWDGKLASQGAERVLYGLVKIIVLAGYAVGQQMTRRVAETEAAWLQGVGELGCYGANLYFQFSGYSDLAIGLALLAGIRIEENFNRPFLATNIGEFWRRWHITLANWCRDYVFTPVSAWTRVPYLGVVASMLVLGAWHEPSLRYLLWGVYHGLGIATWQFLRRQIGEPRLAALPLRRTRGVLGWGLTMAFVTSSFALTSSSSVREALALWARIFTLES